MAKLILIGLLGFAWVATMAMVLRSNKISVPQSTALTTIPLLIIVMTQKEKEEKDD